MAVEVVSFDLHGTLFDHQFVNSVWLEGIPKLYSKTMKTSIHEAIEFVRREYDKIGMERLEWYDVKYWLKRLGLNHDWRKLLNRFSHNIRLYPEVSEVLKDLKSKGLELIITTNSSKEFLEIELKKAGLDRHFSRTFSSTSDFLEAKKTGRVYSKIIDVLGVKPHNITHVGDHWLFDFKIPRKIGIRAYFLNRKKERLGEFVLHSLKGLERRLFETT